MYPYEVKVKDKYREIYSHWCYKTQEEMEKGIIDLIREGYKDIHIKL